ncbi:MAG: response regulator [Alphaproteobacteria bacterium]|jgi:two-component system phosphate regulon response regulator PhoB
MTKKLTPSIMVVEDEESITAIIKYNLKKAGYLVTSTNDGSEAVALCQQYNPDLILLDWMLPGLSGIEICRIIRATPEISNIPIIMISARNEEIDKVMGLDRGADDYISKPFSPNELLARIKAVLRRMRPVFSSKVLEFQDIKLNLSSHTVVRNGKEIELSPIEFKILQMLVENPARVLSREFIMDKIWGTDVYVGSRTIDVHITRLRKALLSASTDGIDLIKTVRLGGYSLNIKKD